MATLLREVSHVGACVCRCIRRWRAHMSGVVCVPPAEIIFFWSGQDYLRKMRSDLSFLPLPVAVDPLLNSWFDRYLVWLLCAEGSSLFDFKLPAGFDPQLTLQCALVTCSMSTLNIGEGRRKGGREMCGEGGREHGAATQRDGEGDGGIEASGKGERQRSEREHGDGGGEVGGQKCGKEEKERGGEEEGGNALGMPNGGEEGTRMQGKAEHEEARTRARASVTRMLVDPPDARAVSKLLRTAQRWARSGHSVERWRWSWYQVILYGAQCYWHLLRALPQCLAHFEEQAAASKLQRTFRRRRASRPAAQNE